MSGSFDPITVDPRARRPSRLPLDTGPTVDERAAAAEAAHAWLETKPACDALRKEAARERIRQRHELAGQMRKSTAPASPQLSSKQYDAFLDSVQQTSLQTKISAADSPRRGTDERSRLAPSHKKLHPLLLRGESGSSEEAPFLNSPSSTGQESSGRSRRSTTESSQLSRRSTAEFLGSAEAAAVEALKYRLLYDEPLSKAEAVEAAVAAVVAVKEAAAEAAAAAEAVAATFAGSNPHSPDVRRNLQFELATARRLQRTPPSSPRTQCHTVTKAAMWHLSVDRSPSARMDARPDHCVTWPCSTEEVRKWAASATRSRRSEAQQWRTARQQAKMPPSSCWVPAPSSDQTGIERAARMKAAVLAKARVSRAAAEDDVHRAIATMWQH